VIAFRIPTSVEIDFFWNSWASLFQISAGMEFSSKTQKFFSAQIQIYRFTVWTFSSVRHSLPIHFSEDSLPIATPIALNSLKSKSGFLICSKFEINPCINNWRDFGQLFNLLLFPSLRKLEDKVKSEQPDWEGLAFDLNWI